MPNWKEVYEETTSFADGSFAEVHTLVYDAEWRNSSAIHIQKFSLHARTTSPLNSLPWLLFRVKILKNQRLPFFGRGSTGPMAPREATYIAITQLPIHFVAIGILIFLVALGKNVLTVSAHLVVKSIPTLLTFGSSSASDGRIHHLLGP